MRARVGRRRSSVMAESWSESWSELWAAFYTPFFIPSFRLRAHANAAASGEVFITKEVWIANEVWIAKEVWITKEGWITGEVLAPSRARAGACWCQRGRRRARTAEIAR